jgi:outer membrane protein assembly factor BamB
MVDASPTYHDGTVYVGSNNNVLYALDVSDGKQIWNFTTGGQIKSSVSVLDPGPGGDPLLIFGSYDARIYALDTSGNQVWNYTAESYIHGKPAIYDNKTFTCSCDTNVYAVDVNTGTKVWNTSINDYSGISPAAANGTLYAAGRGGGIYAINIVDGKIIWNRTTKAVIEASPAVGDGLVFYGNLVGELFALDIETGDQKWLFRTPNEIRILSSPALVGGILYFGDNNGILHALQAEDGKEIWNFSTGSQIETAPAVAYGKVYFGAADGTVYALGDTKPVVAITAPGEWEKVKGAVTVEISVFGGNISSVEVQVDEKKWNPAIEGTDGDTWTYSLKTKKFDNGEHRITARATNGTGVGEDSIYIVIKNKEDKKGFIPGPSVLMVVVASIVGVTIVRRHWRCGRR